MFEGGGGLRRHPVVAVHAVLHHLVHVHLVERSAKPARAEFCGPWCASLNVGFRCIPIFGRVYCLAPHTYRGAQQLTRKREVYIVIGKRGQTLSLGGGRG